MIPADARRSLLAAAMLAAVAGGFWLLRAFDPNAPGSLFPPCLFRTFTGLFCPGCGITRMLHALAHGDVQRAAEMNLMVLAMLPALALIAVNEAASRRFLAPAIARPLYSARLWLAAVAVFGVLRNLPWAPFDALAPG
jgi:hypothetical protein